MEEEEVDRLGKLLEEGKMDKLLEEDKFFQGGRLLEE